MDGKVIVVTGALGALGRVVVDEALARGAQIASVDHAPTQAPATADLFELGGIDLTDAAQAGKAVGPSFSAAEVPDVIEAVLGTYREQRQPVEGGRWETFIDTVKAVMGPSRA